MVVMIRFTQSGNFDKTEKFLRQGRQNIAPILHRYGQEGVDVLAQNTPSETGKTATSWFYKISITKRSFSVTWYNDNMVDGVPVVILLQYGHATKTGGFVQGEDFINPSIQPIFDKLSNTIYKEVFKP